MAIRRSLQGETVEALELDRIQERNELNAQGIEGAPQRAARAVHDRHIAAISRLEQRAQPGSLRRVTRLDEALHELNEIAAGLAVRCQPALVHEAGAESADHAAKDEGHRQDECRLRTEPHGGLLTSNGA